MAPPFEERPTPSCSLCLAGLIAPIGGSFYVGQTTFLTGWFPPFISRPFLFGKRFSKATILLSSAILSSSGVARRAMRLSYIQSLVTRVRTYHRRQAAWASAFRTPKRPLVRHEGAPARENLLPCDSPRAHAAVGGGEGMRAGCERGTDRCGPGGANRRRSDHGCAVLKRDRSGRNSSSRRHRPHRGCQRYCLPGRRGVVRGGQSGGGRRPDEYL